MNMMKRKAFLIVMGILLALGGPLALGGKQTTGGEPRQAVLGIGGMHGP